MADESSSEAACRGVHRRRFLAVSAASSVAVAGCLSLSSDEEIEDWHDLDAVRDDLDEDYALTNDLSEQTAGYSEHVDDPEEGWEPVGDLERGTDLEFSGTFDGQGHEIADLRIDRPETTYVGLFGVNKGTIENVTVADADITGDRVVGGLIGQTHETVMGSTVRESEITGESGVGGIAGVIIRDGDVSLSSVREAEITGREHVGGLAGTVASFGRASNSAVRDVIITGVERVGGFAGFLFGGSVTNSWVSGNVSGEDTVGGFAGEQHVGGQLTGYWNTAVTGQMQGLGTGVKSVTGLTADEMKGEAAKENMQALDFEETWTIRTDPDDYPVFNV